MEEFELRLLRLKEQLGLYEDQQVAEALGMKKAAFSSRKKRGAFPEEAVRELARSRPELGLDTQYIFTGQRKNSVSDQVADYRLAKGGRNDVWITVLEVVVDELNQRGKRLSGRKLVELVDLLADYAIKADGGVDEGFVERQIRLVA